MVDVHEIIFKRVRGHIFLSCHVTMQDNLPLSRVHDVQTALEMRSSWRRRNCFACSFTPSRKPTTGANSEFEMQQSGRGLSSEFME